MCNFHVSMSAVNGIHVSAAKDYSEIKAFNNEKYDEK